MGFGQKKQREPTIVLTLLTWHNSVEDRSVIGSSISITNNKNETHKKKKKKEGTWTPLIPSWILLETLPRTAFASLSVVISQIAKNSRKLQSVQQSGS
ncbi:secE/sec61-gamma protein transport protein [Arabidopsis thaliana]|uniref:SecE/sec61-gamma protein transport protein n=1 Tax=Arabidopsis thaliana TaxID=3702 RepID=A0A1P8B6L2_ARATH|nr:secE/sec61-gamma protein transport protein [Arabidopsis thaliana]ANM67231.1 secE/sec61-gamma protein transport protein [Arabidopsis thaliana]|eukprot:NP_001329073.1 secE/sec61-gamma protein transport protein [Arabidopsis thaliana]